MGKSYHSIKETMTKAIYLFSSALLFLLVLYVFLHGFTEWKHAIYIMQLENLFTKVWLIVIGVFFLWLFLLVLYCLVQSIKKDRLTLVTIILFAVCIVLQTTFVFLMNIDLRYDPLKVWDEAVSMLTDKTISATFDAGYFAKYTNNFPVTILTYFFLKAASVLGVPHVYFMKLVSMLSVVAMDLSILFGYLIINKIMNQKKAVYFLILCIFNPMLLLWSGYYYTATLCMPFFTGGVLLALCLLKEKRRERKYLYAVLLGVTMVLGFKIRATVVIVMIAIMLSFFLFGKTEKRRSVKDTPKYGIALCLIFLLSAWFTFNGYEAVQKKYVTFDYTDTAFPAIHWVMMGANGEGMYNQRDEMYTAALPTKEEKQAGDKALLKTRIKEAGPLGIIKLIGKKLIVTWGDGSSNYTAELSKAQTYTRLSRYITGDKNDFLIYYCQIFHVLVLGMIMVQILNNSIRFLRNPVIPITFPIELILLGGMLFHILWEANQTYSIGFNVILMMLLANGMVVSGRVAAKKRNYVAVLSAFAILLQCFWFGTRAHSFYTTDISQTQWTVNQYLFESDTYIPLLQGGKVVQTMKTDQKFNFISLDFINPKENNTASYLVTITDEKDRTLYQETILASNIQTYVFYPLSFPEITPGKETEYQIKIEAKQADEENYLTLLTYDTGHYDAYQNGVLYQNGVEKHADLTFRSGYTYQEPYVNAIKYWGFAAGILILEILLVLRFTIRGAGYFLVKKRR